jgi:hypothetical protein
MDHAPNVALNGIDGMYRAGNSLIAVQNGVQPERVVEFDLNPGWTKVLDWHPIESGTAGFGDPTHGVLVGDDFWYIANSGWDRVDSGQPGAPMSAGAAPRIMKVHVGGVR